MKSRFKMLRVPLIIILAVSSLILPYGGIKGTTLNLSDKLLWSIGFGLIILFMMSYFWSLLLRSILQVKLLDDKLSFKNLVTRKEIDIKLSEIIELKYSYWTDNTTIVTHNQKIKLLTGIYKNLDELMYNVQQKIDEINS